MSSGDTFNEHVKGAAASSVAEAPGSVVRKKVSNDSSMMDEVTAKSSLTSDVYLSAIKLLERAIGQRRCTKKKAAEEERYLGTIEKLQLKVEKEKEKRKHVLVDDLLHVEPEKEKGNGIDPEKEKTKRLEDGNDTKRSLVEPEKEKRTIFQDGNDIVRFQDEPESEKDKNDNNVEPEKEKIQLVEEIKEIQIEPEKQDIQLQVLLLEDVKDIDRFEVEPEKEKILILEDAEDITRREAEEKTDGRENALTGREFASPSFKEERAASIEDLFKRGTGNNDNVALRPGKDILAQGSEVFNAADSLPTFEIKDKAESEEEEHDEIQKDNKAAQDGNGHPEENKEIATRVQGSRRRTPSPTSSIYDHRSQSLGIACASSSSEDEESEGCNISVTSAEKEACPEKKNDCLEEETELQSQISSSSSSVDGLSEAEEEESEFETETEEEEEENQTTLSQASVNQNSTNSGSEEERSSSSEEEESESSMNYFRSRFQRQGSSGNSSTTNGANANSSFLNPESILRDYRRRKRDGTTSPSVNLSSSSSRDRSPSVARSKSPLVMPAPTINRRARPTAEPPKPPNMEKPQVSVVAAHRTRARNSIKRKDSSKDKDKENGSLSKSASLRRRKHPSDGETSDEAKPGMKKGNYTVEVEVEQTVFIPKPAVAAVAAAVAPPAVEQPQVEEEEEEEEEVDPLSFIEIKSAAQWKAMSGRISWKFDEEEKKEEEIQPSAVIASPKAKKKFNFSINATDSSALSSGIEGFKPTKVQQLRLVCWKVKPWNQPKSGPDARLFSSQFAVAWKVDCDEVYPGLFIGDKQSASNVAFLQKIGVTHVLNTAEGKEEGLVDLDQAHYNSSNIKYLGFPLWDCPNCNIMPYLGCANEFINSAMESGGKCLVNCQMGVSRSSYCAMSYLMISKAMTSVEVLTQFRKHRDVRPNDGFMEQIVALDNDLRRHREHGAERTIILSSLKDLKLLPQAWNNEFWSKPMTEEEIGMPLVPLGDPCPLAVEIISSPVSRRSSRALSRRSSRRNRSKKSSFRSSINSPSLLSRHSSCKSASGPISIKKSDIGDNESIAASQGGESNWEWVWEDEEGNENADPKAGSPLTTKKLELVKDIIEKPEDRWRILWQNARGGCDTPSSAGSVRSFGSNISNASNQVQAGVEGGDPLAMVKVTSAKQWKEISKKLTINLDGIDLNAAQRQEEQPVVPGEFQPSTVQQLRLICWRVKPWDQPRARGLFSSIFATGWGVDCDEVFPNIFIGDEASARNIKFLQRMGITHVLNTAEGIWTDCSFVDLTEEYYQGSGIAYQGLQIWDSTKVRILPYFGCANEFIAKALKGRGKCLINCQMGVSRSCISAMAYMMITEGWEVQDVMREFRKRRDVRPNDHFLEQIVELDNDLKKQKMLKIPRGIKLYSLADLPNLPRPWHYEFWDVIPSQETLPFKLCHMGAPRPDLIQSAGQMDVSAPPEPVKTTQTPIKAPPSPRLNMRDPSVNRLQTNNNINNRLSSASAMTDSSEYEWEYYSDEEEEEEEVESPKVVASSTSVGCARDWMKLSESLSNGAITVQEEEEEEEKAVVTSKPTVFEPTSEKQLRLICWKVKPWTAKKDTKMFSSQFAVLWNVDCDEVFPNLLIGDAAAATNIKFLKHLKITHVLNTAEGDDDGLVNLTGDHYEGSGIAYKGFLMWDSAWFDVSPFIDEAVAFIADAIESGGRCLVNCQMGVSRSSTCALSYMMMKRGWKAVDALRQFRSHRDVRPNDGFMKTIVTIDNKLRRQREGF